MKGTRTHTEAQRHREGRHSCVRYSRSLLLLVLCASVPLCEIRPAAAQEAKGTLLAPKAFRAAASRVQPSLVRIEGFGGIAPGSGGGGYQVPGEGPTTG